MAKIPSTASRADLIRVLRHCLDQHSDENTGLTSVHFYADPADVGALINLLEMPTVDLEDGEEFKFLTPGSGEQIVRRVVNERRGLQGHPKYLDEVLAALDQARAAVQKFRAKEQAVSAGLEGAIRCSITETAESGVMNAIDVLFDEIDEEEMQELVKRIRHDLLLPNIDTEETAGETPCVLDSKCVGNPDIDAIKAQIAAYFGVSPDQITMMEVSESPGDGGPGSSRSLGDFLGDTIRDRRVGPA